MLLSIVGWFFALAGGAVLIYVAYRSGYNRRIKELEAISRLRSTKLTANQVQDIEMTVDENTVAEVRQTAAGLIVTRRPAKEHLIQFPYPQHCSTNSSQLTLMLQDIGPAVCLGTFPLPANYWLEAIKGYVKEP